MVLLQVVLDGLPACTNTVYTAVQNGDPGSHILLTGLATSGNRDYLIQVQGFSGGGPNDPFVNFCINISNPASNIGPNVAAVINQCGTTYNGTTNGGYYDSGTGLRRANLDGNNGTTLSGQTVGDDVSFVVNNISWFKFCTINAGTYNVQFDVISCTNSSFIGATGGQMAILTGTNTNLTNIWQAANPTLVSTAVQTSPNFTLAAGGCAYLVVDGFAGDACSYSYVLTNVSGGCALLPIELLYFNAVNISCTENLINWSTATERDNAYFELERSHDAIHFEIIAKIPGAGNSLEIQKYKFKDVNPERTINYYRLRQVDFDGNSEMFSITSVDNSCGKNLKVIKVTNMLGQEVNEDYEGVRIIQYNDGSVVKKTFDNQK
jgi:hypothetical protein